jgi:transposase
MYYVLSKDIIESEIICHLPVRKRGFKSQAPTSEIINCILYKLKTGIQWHLLPVESLFSTHVLHYKTVFGIIVDGVKRDLAKMLDRTFEKV